MPFIVLPVSVDFLIISIRLMALLHFALPSVSIIVIAELCIAALYLISLHPLQLTLNVLPFLFIKEASHSHIMEQGTGLGASYVTCPQILLQDQSIHIHFGGLPNEEVVDQFNMEDR